MAARVVLDRAAFRRLDEAMLAGLEDLAARVLDEVEAPDAEPFGEGLVTRGAYASFLDGRQVGGEAERPSGMDADGIVVAVGFGFPAAFQELGTVHQPARPFLAPVVMHLFGESSVVAAALRSRLRG